MSTTDVPTGRAMDGDVERLAERLELVRCGRPVRVRGDEQRPATLLDEVPGELGGRGRLARALEADHRDDRGVAGEVERPVAGAEERDELVVDDLHDLLAGGQALEDLGADRPLADPADEVLDDLEVDVGLEEAEPDLAHRGVDVRLADAAATGQVGEGLAQAFAEVVEHGSGGTPSWMGPGGGPHGDADRVVHEFWRTEAGEVYPIGSIRPGYASRDGRPDSHAPGCRSGATRRSSGSSARRPCRSSARS